MDRLVIRRATPEDIPAICHVNRQEEGPWAAPDSCRAWVLRRLEQGFYVQVAELNGQVAAHGEWVISDEHRWKTCYLGQLIVDADRRFQGIGRKMLADGLAYARANLCDSLSLLPEQDTHSEQFYKKCGLVRGKDLLYGAVSAHEGVVTGETAAEAPLCVVRELPMLFGLFQTAARHMWQVFNRPPEGNDWRTHTLLGGDFCIQLSGRAGNQAARLLAWGRPEQAKALLANARAFAHKCGYAKLTTCFFPEMRESVSEMKVEVDNYEMYRLL